MKFIITEIEGVPFTPIKFEKTDVSNVRGGYGRGLPFQHRFIKPVTKLGKKTIENIFK